MWATSDLCMCILRSLGKEDMLMDGFYECYGDFPEIVDENQFPTLDNLRKVRTGDGDPREVGFLGVNSPLHFPSSPICYTSMLRICKC